MAGGSLMSTGTPDLRFTRDEVEAATSGSKRPWTRQLQFTGEIDAEEIAGAAAAYGRAAAEARGAQDLAQRADQISTQSGGLDGSSIVDGRGRIDETRGGLQDGGADIDAVAGHLVFAMNLALAAEENVRELIFGPQGLETKYFDHLRAAVEEWNGWVQALSDAVANQSDFREGLGIWSMGGGGARGAGEPVPPEVTHPNGETRLPHLTAGGWALPDDLAGKIREKYLRLAAKDAEASWDDIEAEIEWYRRRMAERAEELRRLGHDVSAGPLGLWGGSQGSEPHVPGQILGDTSKLGGWIPVSVPEESRRTLTDIRRYGVEAQGAGGQRMGPLFPESFGNTGRNGGYQLPQFDSAGQEIEYTEWGTVQSADNPNWGGERIVTGSDGSAYYTPTHYQTWIVMEAGE